MTNAWKFNVLFRKDQDNAFFPDAYYVEVSPVEFNGKLPCTCIEFNKFLSTYTPERFTPGTFPCTLFYCWVMDKHQALWLKELIDGVFNGKNVFNIINGELIMTSNEFDTSWCLDVVYMGGAGMGFVVKVTPKAGCKMPCTIEQFNTIIREHTKAKYVDNCNLGIYTSNFNNIVYADEQVQLIKKLFCGKNLLKSLKPTKSQKQKVESRRAEIFVEKVMQQGIPQYKVLGWKNIMKQEELPRGYLASRYWFYESCMDSIVVGSKIFFTVKKGDIIAPYQLEYLKYCGENLAVIKKSLKEQNIVYSTWAGRETIVI